MTSVALSLAGAESNKAIVLFDYTNKLRQPGLFFIDTVITAGATRLRPVVLTAVTTFQTLVVVPYCIA